MSQAIVWNKDAYYLCFTVDHKPEQARATFVDRYGVPPAGWSWHDGLLWVGPVPEVDRANGQRLGVIMAQAA